MSTSEKEYTVYSNQITSYEPEDVRGTYVHNTIFFGYLPNDFEAVTFYKCLGFGFTDSKRVPGIAFSEEEIKDVRVYSTAVVEDVDLSGFVFENVFGFRSVKFLHCDFRNTRFLEPCALHLNLFDCSLEGAVLSQSSSLGFNLKLESTSLVGCTLEKFDLADLFPRPSFKGATLRNCLYQGVVSDLRDIDLAEKIDGVFVDDPKYSGRGGFYYLADGQNLRGADFSIFSDRITTQSSPFSFSDSGSLRDCDLRDSNLDRTLLFTSSILSGSDLRGSSLKELAVLTGSALLDLSRTDLRGIRGLSLTSESKSREVRVSLFEARFDPSLLQGMAEGLPLGTCVVTLDIESFAPNPQYSATDIRSKFQVYRVPIASNREPTTYALSRALGVEALDDALLKEVTICFREEESTAFPVYIGRGCKLLGLGARYRYSGDNLRTKKNVCFPQHADCSDSMFVSLRTETDLVGLVFDRSTFVDVVFQLDRFGLAGGELAQCSFRQSTFESTLLSYTEIARCDFSEAKGSISINLSAWDWHMDRCDFTRAKLDLKLTADGGKHTDVSNCKFSHAEIDFKAMQSIRFTDTDFRGSRISNLVADDGHLENCDLRGAYFEDTCTFDNTKFTGSIYDEHTVIDLEDWQLEEMTFVESGAAK